LSPAGRAVHASLVRPTHATVAKPIIDGQYTQLNRHWNSYTILAESDFGSKYIPLALGRTKNWNSSTLSLGTWGSVQRLAAHHQQFES
jgi:hypothetical protein